MSRVGHHGGARVAVRAGFTEIPGTGDLWTTVDDLVRLHQALRSGAVVRPELAALLWTRHARVPGGDASGDGPVVVEAYGYGTFLGRVAGHPASVHPGDNPGYRSLLAHLPDLDVDLAVLTNDDGPGVETVVAELARRQHWG